MIRVSVLIYVGGKMSEERTKEEKLTPMMQQYRAIKAEHQDKVLFFRLGDFYEMFMEDAMEVSRLLNLTLTQRAGVPMCGIPFHAAKNYIKRLLDEGKKIAVCEQLELPDSPRQLAKRDVVQVITPATVVDDDLLDSHSNNYLLAISCVADALLVSYADISTGDFYLQKLPLESRYMALRTLFEQIGPREVLVNEDDYFTKEEFAKVADESMAMVTKLPPWFFSVAEGFSLLCAQAGTNTLKSFGISNDEPALAAASALMRYLQDTARTSLGQITSFVLVDDAVSLQIDESSRKNLEILANLHDGSAHFTLFEAVDRTRTAGGARMLKSWLSNPLADRKSIEARHEWIAWLLADRQELARVRKILGVTLDLVRLTSRVAMKRAMPHDLVSIKQTASCFFSLVSEHFEQYATLLDSHLSQQKLEAVVALTDLIGRAVNEQCLGPFVEGEVIVDGFDEELDSLRSLRDHGADVLKEYLSKVRQETGITTLRLSYNKIIGHFLEVSKGQVDKVPASFYRKQTLVNAERFTTDELIECETKILRAASDAEKRERYLYDQVVDRTAESLDDLVALGRFLSEIDCYQGFATVASDSNYVRPEFVDEDVLEIEQGRHPVVERQLQPGGFVCNGISLAGPGTRFCLITGPNMAGKSTYLRQNALIVLLAQAGSYVPAAKARIGLVDKLFCRVGASDNLARGESTFLVEMQEAAYILRTATSHSLVIMDEIGRGTSTQDGMSIAYAVMRKLIALDAKTLFATHYHELTMLDTTGIQLLTLDVAEHRNNIVFLRKIRKGVANSSYGLHVARLAGVPADVVKEASAFQRQHFADYSLAGNDLQLDLFIGGGETSGSSDSPAGHAVDDFSPPGSVSAEVSEVGRLFDLAKDNVLYPLAEFQLEKSTPLQAMLLLGDLQPKASELLQND